jgi:2-phospho-L-lactate guanylyltransferase
LVIPLKPLPRAKSRLADTAGDGLRPGLALAFAQDTVAAALACAAVREVAVVTDDPLAGRELAALGARIVPDEPVGGLNTALAYASAVVRSWHRSQAVTGPLRDTTTSATGATAATGAIAALNADLPALRPAELLRVLDAAAAFPRAFLADAAGVGTTLLAAAPGRELRPAFGTDSRRRHRASGAVELALDGVESVRQDVDTGDDLRAALTLGVGPRTAAATARLALPGRPLGPGQ